jgi:SAM-dependent methyltransferase
MADLLRPGTTYLPHSFSAAALERFGRGDTKALEEELEGKSGSYERVGVDRALGIAIDLALLGVRPDASILDIGCSVGTISVLLSRIGYRVTGIDSDIVAQVQDWQDTEALSAARTGIESANCRLIQVDLRDHLASLEGSHDIALLLSVVHHWLAGYGYSGQEQFDRAEVRETLEELCRRVRSHIYLEVPIGDEAEEMPPDPQEEFLFPDWFLTAGLATDVSLVTSTVATNGKPRRMYRIDL